MCAVNGLLDCLALFILSPCDDTCVMIFRHVGLFLVVSAFGLKRVGESFQSVHFQTRSTRKGTVWLANIPVSVRIMQELTGVIFAK